MEKARAGSLRRQHTPPHAPARVTSKRRARANTDTVKLLMLGYKQELEREFTLFNSFGCNFAFLSTLTSLTGGYVIGVVYGGPVVMMWGWLIVLFFNLSVGLSMAELASAYPTSGALYYWSYKLAPPRLRNLACWMTAWILTLGEASLCASSFYTFVHMLATAVEVHYGVPLTNPEVFALLLVTTAIIGLLNCGPVRLTAFMTTLGTMWNIVGSVAFCLCVPLIAPAKHSAKYLFTAWQQYPEYTGISSSIYTTLVGLLMSQWSLIGYDASAHLAEETFHAEINVPRAIMLTISGLGLTGFAFLLTLASVHVDVVVLLDPNNETHGSNIVLQILVEVTKTYGSVSSGVALFSIPIVAAFFCSYQAIANNSRMLYAFARDDGVPLASYAKRVHPRTKAPVYAVLYMLVLTNMLAAPMCFNFYVVPAIASFSVVGCCLAYALPVMCKLSTGRRFFLPGPFFLGPRLSYINNIVTLIWVLAMTVLFLLPQFYPITVVNLNWAAPILGFVLLCSLGWFYFPKYGAQMWFIGPRANLGQFKDELPSERARKVAEAEAAEAAAAVTVSRAAQAAAEATELLARVANGTCGGTAPSVPGSEHRSHRSSRCSAGRSLTHSLAGTTSSVLPVDLSDAAAALSGRPASIRAVTSSIHVTYGPGSPTSGRGPASRASSRRHSALASVHSSSFHGPNITVLLQGSASRDGYGSASGAGMGLMSSCDGQLPPGMEGGRAGGREWSAPRRLSSRHPLSPERLDHVGAAAAAGGTASMEHGSGYSRERLSLLMRAVAGNSAGISLQPPPGSPLHHVTEGSVLLLERLEDTSALSSRTRLRRASVSVLALPTRSGGGLEDVIGRSSVLTSAPVPAAAATGTTTTATTTTVEALQLSAAEQDAGTGSVSRELGSGSVAVQ